MRVLGTRDFAFAKDSDLSWVSTKYSSRKKLCFVDNKEEFGEWERLLWWHLGDGVSLVS